MRKTFFKKGVRELRQHKMQYLFLIIILALGVASYTSFNSMMDSRWASFNASYEESRFMDLQVKLQYGTTADISSIEDILVFSKTSNEISEIEYRINYDAFLSFSKNGERQIYKGMIIGYQTFDQNGAPRELGVNKPLFFNDDPSAFSAPDAMECYVEHNFANYQGILPGTILEIQRGNVILELTVLEQVVIPEYIYVIPEGGILPVSDLGVIMVPMETALLLAEEGQVGTQVNDIVLTLKDTSDLKAVKESISNAFENNGLPVNIIEKEDNPSRNISIEDMEGDQGIVMMFPLLIFAVSGFGLIVAFRRMIQSHKSQIGIFKALGVSNNVILLYFSIIGLLVASLGILLGWIITFPMNMAFESLVAEVTGFPIIVYVVPVKYYIYAGVVSIAVCLACTFLPVWGALRIRPIDAIQHREGVMQKKLGSVIKRVSGLKRLPVSFRLTIRNMLRKPGRNISTMLGVAFSIALFLGFVILLNSFVIEMDEENEIAVYDYEVGLQGFYPYTIFQDWDGDITSFNPAIMISSMTTGATEPDTLLIYAVDDLSEVYELEYEKGGLTEDGIVISKQISDKYNLNVGDRITLELPKYSEGIGFTMGNSTFEVSGVHNGLLGIYAYMQLGTLQDATNLRDVANIVYLKTADGEASRTLENSIITTPGVTSVIHRTQKTNYLDQYMGLLMQTFGVIALLSVVLAGAISYNLFMINAQDSKREYATMKTLGTSMKGIRNLIFIEGGILAIAGIILGGIFGQGLAEYLIISAQQMELFNLELQFSWWGFGASALLIAFVIVMVSILTLRYIGKINMADVIRERTP